MVGELILAGFLGASGVYVGVYTALLVLRAGIRGFKAGAGFHD